MAGREKSWRVGSFARKVPIGRLNLVRSLIVLAVLPIPNGSFGQIDSIDTSAAAFLNLGAVKRVRHQKERISSSITAEEPNF